MNNCGEWASASEIVRRVQAYNKGISGKRGDRKSILDAIRNLADDDCLEYREVKNKHEYMRNDKSDSELKFSSIMKGFEDIQKMQLAEINTDKIIFLSNNRLAIDGEMLLDSIQDEMERAYTLMVRMNYQAQLDVISKRTANERSERLQKHIDKTMKMLKRKYPANLIKEYFQNHVKRLEFKI